MIERNPKGTEAHRIQPKVVADVAIRGEEDEDVKTRAHNHKLSTKGRSIYISTVHGRHTRLVSSEP